MNFCIILRRIPTRQFWALMWGKIFHQGRVDKNGNIIPPRKFLRNFNQIIIEKGCTPPWIITRDECKYFWSSITNDEKFTGNRPIAYASKSLGINCFLHNFWRPENDPENSILELCCNCGVNLYGLYNLGYKKLTGIEINKNAIQEMKNSFSDLSQTTTVLEGSLEEILPKMESKSIDVVFTIAVLIHIHPVSHFIFSDIVRIAKKYIIVIEEETANCSYVFVRNYRRVFQLLGCSQLKSVMITKESFPNVSRDYDGYTARMFSVPNSL